MESDVLVSERTCLIFGGNMENDAILTVTDLGVWAYHKFGKMNRRITCLTIGVLCLSAGGYLAARHIIDSKARIADLDVQLKLILNHIANNEASEMPVSD